jgi:hypothetical protein
MEKQIFKRKTRSFDVDFGFEFMSWEQDSRKRNTNNVVKFHLNEDLTVNVGDELIGDSSGERVSVYTIIDVVEIRPSNMKGLNYITVRTSWESVKSN